VECVVFFWVSSNPNNQVTGKHRVFNIITSEHLKTLMSGTSSHPSELYRRATCMLKIKQVFVGLRPKLQLQPREYLSNLFKARIFCL